MKLLELDKKTIRYLGITIMAIILVISIVLLSFHFGRNTDSYVEYDEKSDLDYKVEIKNNDYFETQYLDKEQQYIASLIEIIKADFKYNLNIKDDLEYSYKYKIEGHINVIDDNTNKPVYQFTENFIEEVTGQTTGELNINENIEIDYNKYNDEISRFVNEYKLRDTTSKLQVKMYLQIASSEQDLKKEDAVITMEIPLTTNTIAIDVKYDVSNNVKNLIESNKFQKNSKVFLRIAIFLLGIDIMFLVMFIIYLKNTQTEEDKYNLEVKKILNNYGSYISKVEDEFNMKQYQILKVQSFIDLLEIRDTMQIPIIMIENKESLSTCFIIPTANNILYFYSLGVTQYALPSNNEDIWSEKDEEEV